VALELQDVPGDGSQAVIVLDEQDDHSGVT
jgi:hypothetical protein